MQRLRLEVCVPLQMTPRLVPADNGDLRDAETSLKHAADALMAHVVENDVFKAQRLAALSECLRNGFGMYREDAFTGPLLIKDYFK